jgi:RNA polymerase sigma-70 factor (ECF subfamily)
MTQSAGDPLAVAAKQGERRAFEALMRREKAGLYAFVRRYVRDADEAYDVLQDAFVAAWRAIGRYDPHRPFGVWLRAIALNKCRDHGRRALVRGLFLGRLAAEPDPAPVDDEREARLARLDAAIARLPAGERDLVLLTTAGGLGHEAAGQVLGLSAKAVEMRLYRARRRLAGLLGENGEG